MNTNHESELLRQFEAGGIEPGTFGHREHLQVAYEMLHKYPYPRACAEYAEAIAAIAENAGSPEKFNVTITFAFLSLIAERIHAAGGYSNFDAFLARNEDLESPNALSRWYSSEQLRSDFARTHFLLPTRAA